MFLFSRARPGFLKRFQSSAADSTKPIARKMPKNRSGSENVSQITGKRFATCLPSSV